MSLLQDALTRLGEIPANGRKRTNIAAVMQELQYSHLSLKTLAKHGLVRNTVTDSYGRGLVHEVRRTKIPDASEVLVVTMPSGFAPAIHDHGADSDGAHILAVDGYFYNITYKTIEDPHGDKVITHSRIQEIKQGDVAFIPGGHKGMHRVVNTSKKAHLSFNFYWNNQPGATLSPSAYVYDFGVGKGSRVTTGGPAFYFVDGEDRKSGFKASALVQLEDLVLQHKQLFTAHREGKLTGERHSIFSDLHKILTGPDIKNILISARRLATIFVKQQTEQNQPIAIQYFEHLFERALKISALYDKEKEYKHNLQQGLPGRGKTR